VAVAISWSESLEVNFQ